MFLDVTELEIFTPYSQCALFFYFFDKLSELSVCCHDF